MISQIAISASMQLLWNLVNLMQLIVYLPLYNVAYPANTILFYSFLRDLSNFDVIPTEKLNRY
jgi:hypothetical protein